VNHVDMREYIIGLGGIVGMDALVVFMHEYGIEHSPPQ
jgi:hypothetical protein